MDVLSSSAQTTGRGTLVLAYEIVHGSQLRLTVSGSELADIPGWVVQLMTAPGPRLLQLELDLSNETSLNPAGLALLLRARAAVRTRQGELRLRGLRPMVREQLAAIGLPELTRSPADVTFPPETAGEAALCGPTAAGAGRASFCNRTGS